MGKSADRCHPVVAHVVHSAQQLIQGLAALTGALFQPTDPLVLALRKLENFVAGRGFVPRDGQIGFVDFASGGGIQTVGAAELEEVSGASTEERERQHGHVAAEMERSDSKCCNDTGDEPDQDGQPTIGLVQVQNVFAAVVSVSDAASLFEMGTWQPPHLRQMNHLALARQAHEPALGFFAHVANDHGAALFHVRLEAADARHDTHEARAELVRVTRADGSGQEAHRTVRPLHVVSTGDQEFLVALEEAPTGRENGLEPSVAHPSAAPTQVLDFEPRRESNLPNGLDAVALLDVGEQRGRQADVQLVFFFGRHRSAWDALSNGPANEILSRNCVWH